MKSYPRICIIDDDDIATFGLKRSLKIFEFTCDLSIFKNGLDALESFQELLAKGLALPSLVFIDLNMPVMDGWEFMEEFVKLKIPQNDAPEIYIMTSSIDNEDIVNTKIYGLEGHDLIKPISIEVLQNIIE